METLSGITAKGTSYTLAMSNGGRYRLSMPAYAVRDAQARERTVQGMQVLQTDGAHTVPGHGRVRPAIPITPEIREWMAQADAAAQALAKAARQAEADIRQGRVPVTVTYRDGEYLSGHTCYGLPGELLVSIGVASHVEGWGVHVDPKLIEALGESLSFPEAVAFAEPARAAKEAAAQARADTRTAVFAQAAQTGQRQELTRRVEECDESVEDCSTDIVTVWAMPDGTTSTTRIHTH